MYLDFFETTLFKLEIYLQQFGKKHLLFQRKKFLMTNVNFKKITYCKKILGNNSAIIKIFCN